MKGNSFLSTILFSIILTSFSFSQERMNEKLDLTGNLYTDSKIIQSTYTPNTINPMADDLPGKKSPLLSGVLSAVVPGAGQFYNEDYWIAGIFVAVEAALITTAVVYDNKGDDQTNFFQNYADDYTNPNHHWSVVDYAEWLVTYHNADRSKIIISEDQNLPPWQRVDWNELNAAEVGSHHLYPHGDQQYYEMIGKYNQFMEGWDDWIQGGPSLTPHRDYYETLRDNSNKELIKASYCAMIALANHVISAFDASWSVRRHNRKIESKARMGLKKVRGEYVPVLTMDLSW